ncbi:hypothetical protein CJC76_004576 [Escherichia coli]|nr:hypothetical protein [Escherichia coli]
MPTVPISMRKLKEILRLKYGVGLSHRQIGRSLAISPSVVSRYANRAAAYSALFDHGLASKSDQRFASIRSTGNLTFSTAF